MRSPLNCTTIRAQFTDHLQGRLPPAAALALAQHLQGCPACRQELVLERRLRALPPVAAPAGFAAAVVAQLHTRPARPDWIRTALGGAAADTAFRVLVDPLLHLDLELRQAGAPHRQLLRTAFAALQERLRREGTKLGQWLALPLLDAGRQVRAALADPTDSH